MHPHRLFLVRHGQNIANITREFSYRNIDYSLTDTGREQAHHTARYFCDIGPHVVFSSPLKRAIETAVPIAQLIHSEPIVLEGFREINPGDLEGAEPSDENWQFYDSIITAWIGAEHDRRFPGGEDFHEVADRVRRALVDVARHDGGEHRVVVSHGGAILAALHVLLPGLDLADYWKLGIGNCSVTEVEVTLAAGVRGGELVRFGDNAHIPGARPGWH